MFYHNFATLIFFLSFCAPARPQNAQNDTGYVLGPNLLVNPEFADPPLAAGLLYIYNNDTMGGWTCQKTCEIKNPALICKNFHMNCNGVNLTQVLDLDSVGRFDNISQTVWIPSEGNYSLEVRWMTPLSRAVGKKFKVFINSTVVMDEAIPSSIIQ